MSIVDALINTICSHHNLPVLQDHVIGMNTCNWGCFDGLKMASSSKWNQQAEECCHLSVCTFWTSYCLLVLVKVAKWKFKVTRFARYSYVGTVKVYALQYTMVYYIYFGYSGVLRGERSASDDSLTGVPHTHTHTHSNTHTHNTKLHIYTWYATQLVP